MKTKLLVLTAALLVMHAFASAQFVKEFNPGPTSNLIFTCIAKAQNGNYFISGLQDTSIYVSEITAAGVVVREKLIGIGTNYYRLASMIVDGDGNIVIVGIWRAPAGGLIHAYLMKISPALSLIAHITYNNASDVDGMGFSDIKDYKTTGVNNAYYVTGYTFGGTGWNSVLTKLDRTTGTIINIFYGRPSGVAGNSVFTAYQNLVLDTAQTATSPGGIYVTAPLNSGSNASSRPWLTKHNIGTLAFTRAERYLRDITNAQQASVYDLGLAKDKDNLLYCWYGSPNVASTNTHTAMGLTKVVAATLAPVWQKAYTLSPAAPAPFKYLALAKVENDADGYITRGVWSDGINEGGGDIFFIRTDKNGMPIWSRQYKNVSNVQSFNSSFIVDGGNIFAVGYRTNSGNNKGIFIVTPLATGAMDTTCAFPLIVTTKDSIYAKPDAMQALNLNVKLENSYYPVNCVTTPNKKPCSGCINGGVVLPDANFTLTTQLVGTNLTFTATASAYATTNNSQFVVSQVTSAFVDVPGTTLTVPSWGTGATSVFPFYTGTGSAGTNVTGVFQAASFYRFRHILSGYNACGVLKADTAGKIAMMAQGLMGGTKIIIIDENSAAGKAALLKMVQSSITVTKTPPSGTPAIYPNPADASVTFNTAAIKDENVSIKIVNGSGQVVSGGNLKSKSQSSVDTHLWANGLYLYNITANGKVVAQGKFIVQH